MSIALLDSMTDTLIIGAGAAGLMAANQLCESGASIKILESRGRTGGRIFTVSQDPLVEVGAEFLHGKTPVTDRLISQFRLADYELQLQHARFINGKLVSDPKFWERLTRVLSEIRAPRHDLPFAEYLDRYDRHSLLDQQLSRGFVEGFDAADLDHISTHALKEMKDQVAKPEARQLRRLLQGYGSIVQALTAPVEKHIQYHHRVDRIEWKRGRAQVDGCLVDSGKRFRETAQTIIITLPLSILQSLDVWPRLESFQHVLDQNHMGHVNKWVLRLDPRFFEKYRDEGFPFVTAPDLHFTAWWAADPIRWPTITAWAGGRRAQMLSAFPESEQLTALLGDLARISRQSRKRIESWLETAYTHNWSRDPDSQGAYSYPAVRKGIETSRVLTAYEQTLFLAGEAFHPDMTGTVEGALATGENAAKKALASLNRSRLSKSAYRVRKPPIRSRSRL